MHVINNETQIAMITKELIASQVSEKRLQSPKQRITTVCNVSPCEKILS